MRTYRVVRGQRRTQRSGARLTEAQRAEKARENEEKKAAKLKKKEEKKAAKLKQNEEKKAMKASTSAAEKKKDEDKRLLELLTSNLAATADESILDSPTFEGYTETVREDIHTLTDNDRIVAPMKVTIAAVFGHLAYPEWDTRKHQVGIGGLKSLRTLDHTFVANKLHELGLYRTPTEGILTRSFELKHPFTMSYPGEINPAKSKLAFLRLTNRVNEDTNRNVAETILRYFLRRLQESKVKVDSLVGERLETDKKVSIKTLNDILDEMFNLGAGMSATPAIVTHTAFSVIQPHIWKDIGMSPLKRHTASDSTSQAIGDVEAYRNEVPFLSVEIKHKLKIEDSMVRIFSQKTKDVPLRFMLTTSAIHTKYTDDNILIGNVTDVLLQYLHSVIIHEPDIAKTFVTRLREALIGSPDVSATNKTKISELFTKHFAVPSLG